MLYLHHVSVCVTDLERATRDLEQVATMLRDLTRGFANVN